MFGDLGWPLNTSRGLSASAEFIVNFISQMPDGKTDYFFLIRQHAWLHLMCICSYFLLPNTLCPQNSTTLFFCIYSFFVCIYSLIYSFLIVMVKKLLKSVKRNEKSYCRNKSGTAGFDTPYTVGEITWYD